MTSQFRVGLAALLVSSVLVPNASAQPLDFYAAFGLGEDPLRIGTLDADGVALAGPKAVEARTREMRAEHERLQQRVAELERMLSDTLDVVRTLQGGRR